MFVPAIGVGDCFVITQSLRSRRLLYKTIDREEVLDIRFSIPGAGVLVCKSISRRIGRWLLRFSLGLWIVSLIEFPFFLKRWLDLFCHFPSRWLMLVLFSPNPYGLFLHDAIICYFKYFYFRFTVHSHLNKKDNY